jgi:hypothetical protein
MTKVPTPEDFIESFPASPSKIEGQPNYDTLTALREVLKQNAASVTTSRGGGVHGYLGIILSDAMHANIAPGTPFEAPDFPGNQPTIPGGATGPQIAEIVRNHTEQLQEWREHNHVAAALRLQIVKSMEPVYLRSQLDRHVGFANKTPRTLITYLFDSYGRLTPQRLSENHQSLSKPWDPNAPFEDLIDQIEIAKDMADDGNQPYTDPQILNTAYTLVYNTGLYFDECKTWNAKAVADKTWDNFKTHFLAAQTELRTQQQATSGRHGYGHWVQEEDQENSTALAIATLAESAIQERTAFAAISEVNTNLTKQLEIALKAITAMQTSQPTSNKTKPPRKEHKPHDGYCWSHGFHISAKHNSGTCKFPKTGHKKEANKDNMMGGSTEGQGT